MNSENHGFSAIRSRRTGLREALLCSIGLVALGASPASAGLTDFSLYWSAEYQQTGPTTVVPFNSGTNYFFTSLADVNSAADYDVNGLTVTVPTSPTTQYTMNGPSGSSPFIEYVYQSSYMTQSQLNSNFPSGDYVLNAVNTGTGATAQVTMSYDGASFFSAPPALTAASYDGLAGMNASQPYDLVYSPFVPTGGNYARIFLNITDLSTNAVVFSDTFLNTGTTSITIPADTLLPGTAYSEELDFSTRTQTTDPSMINCVGSDPSQCAGLGLTELAWDSRTIGYFTTAIPEPSTWAMMLIGFAGLGYGAYRRSAKLSSGVTRA
jgi:PEP-CTERM motif